MAEDKKYIDYKTGEKVSLSEWNRRNDAQKTQPATQYSFVKPSNTNNPILNNGYVKPALNLPNNPILKNQYVPTENKPQPTYSFVTPAQRSVKYESPLNANKVRANLEQNMPKKTQYDEVTKEYITPEEFKQRKSDPSYYKSELKNINNIKDSFNIGGYKDKSEKFKRLDDAIKEINAKELERKTNVYNENLLAEKSELGRVTQNENFIFYATKGRDVKNNFVEKTIRDSKGKEKGRYYPANYMTQRERDIYNYYVGKDGVQKAAEYFKVIERDLNQRMTEKESAKSYEFGEKHQALSYPTHAIRSLGAGIGSMLETTDQLLQNKVSGKFEPVDTNASATLLQNKQNAMTEGMINKYSPTGQFLAQTGLSILDMAATLPFGKVASLILMSSNAAGSSALNASQKGASPEQAFTLGLTSGAIEYVTEKIGIDNLFRLIGKPSASIVKEIYKQLTTEGLEEFVSQYANFFADEKIMGDKSDYNLYVKELMRVGFTKEQAERDAKVKFLIKDPIQSFIGGAISGGVFGGVGATYGRFNAGSNILSNNANEVINRGTELGIPTATQIQQNIVDGKNPSAWSMGKLAGEIETSNNYTVKTQAPVDSETYTFLKNLSERAKINIEVADIKDTSGKQMSRTEGYYDRKENKIVFSPNVTKKGMIEGVAIHELTHSIENSNEYGEYKSYVLEKAYGNDTKAYVEDINKKVLTYAENNINLSNADAESELIAEYTRNNIYNETEVNRLVSDKPNVAVQIYQGIVKAIDTAKAYLTGDTETLELEKARKLFEKALNERGVNTGTDTPQMSIKDNASTAGATADTDMRFSLKSPVEETKDLIALHNLSEGQLVSSLELGGFPMPSIAVMKSGTSHDRYGDVTVVFGKDTINPTNKKNKLYGGDAWTPEFPTVAYKINGKELLKIRNTVNGILNDTDYKNVFRLAIDSDNVSDNADRNNGDVAGYYNSNPAMQLAFLKQSKIPFKVETKTKQFGNYDIKLLDKIISKYGNSLMSISQLGFEDKTKHEPEIRKIANDFYKEFLDGKDFYKDKMGFSDLDNMLYSAAQYQKEDNVKETDSYATRDKLSEYFKKHPRHEKAYTVWVNNLFKGVIEKRGIRNNTDFFTPSGNRRSFEALHYEYTLDNILKTMAQGTQKGQGVMGGTSAIIGASAKEYSSIEAMKADKSRLKLIDDAEMQQLKKDIEGRLMGVINKMVEGKSSYNSFVLVDDAAEVIAESVAKGNAPNAIYRHISQWGDTFNVTPEIASEIADIKREAGELPTEYFEAKPQRAVGLNEIAKAIIPKSASKKLKQALKDNGINFATYDTEIEGDRLAKVNSTQNVKFSVKDNEQNTKRSEFYENTIKRAKDIPQEVKDKLNPESFDFIPESSKEWQKQAEKNVNADMDGVIERLKNAPSISGGIEGHEAAIVAQRLVNKFKKSGSEEDFKEMQDFLKTVAAKTRESARALKATDTAWDKTDPAAAVIRAERTVQKVIEDEKRRNPKKFADAESEKKQLQTKMKNAEKLAQKDKAQKKLSDEQTKKIEDKRKKQMLERWVRDTVPRAKQKNMLEKIQEMYEAGAYNDEGLARLISEKRDIPYLSLDEVKKVIGYMDKANKLKEGSYEQRMAFSRAEQIIESKLPVTTRDKIKAFPRISILTGTRTQARNVVGNVIHGTYEAARENTVGLLVDVITSKFTGERKLTGNAIGKTSAYMKGFNMGVSEWYKDIRNKVDTSPTRTRGEVKRNSRTFNSAFLNAIDSVVKKGLSLGDRPFYQGAYEARLYELGKLNEKAKTKMSMDEMVLEAQAYALDKVYQNDSTVKKVATRLRNVSTAIDNPFWQGVAEVGMTMTVPFTETPANIFDKVLENSPIGITKAAIEIGKTKNGTFDQMKFVQNLSRGMTGTGLMALGAMLLSKGIISIVPWDEEYDKYKFMQSIGAQNYALKIGDKYYSLSWVEPIATPILIGAEIARGSDNDKNMIENLFGTTKIAIDSFFESSFVQGISELFSSDSIGEGVAKKLIDAHSMFTPLSAFGKALTQWMDPYVRETKDNSPLMQMLKERVAETPFLSKTLPTRIDVFGNEVKTLDGENHVFNVFFNPANVTDYVTTEVHDEIIKMYDTTEDINVFPDYINKPEIKYDGNAVTLDEKGFEKHKKEIGRALYDEYEKLFKTDTYKSMTAGEKAKAIRDAKADIKNQANFKAIKSSRDFLSGLTQNKQLYYDKTDLKLEADYLERWEELTPQDNKTVRDARLYDAVSDAVKAFDKSGSLSKDNMAKIKQYAENKRKREPTMMDLQLIAVYKATGEASVFNTNYQGLLEFTDEKVPRIINYPKTLLPELLAKSDSAVLEAYSKVMLSNGWLKMTSVQRFNALKKAKDKARKAFKEDLKNKYGAKIDTTNKKWQAMTPQEKAAAANKGYKIN